VTVKTRGPLRGEDDQTELYNSTLVKQKIYVTRFKNLQKI
jgi:hypothetical protein